jgi:3-oxoacyl-[acyl-carrier-protein] synthase III
MTHTTTTTEQGPAGAHLLSGFAMTTVLEAHGLFTWESAYLDVLAGDAAGAMLIEMMTRAVLQLQDAVADAARATIKLTKATRDVQEAVSGALHVDVGWVEQATREVVTAVRARDAAVRDYQAAQRVAREHLTGIQGA